MGDTDNRRPLKSRGTAWAQWLTVRLAATAITPNQISALSMVFAAIAGGLFMLTTHVIGGLYVACLLGAALCVQLRLLCNLMDGLVAIEAGKSSADGGFWNEFPDRIADILILVGFGFAAGSPTLGWAAASLAVLTAYIRELGGNLGLPADFCGPMAKPHRMAAVTAGALLAFIASFWYLGYVVLSAMLMLIIAGTAITCARRAYRLVRALKASQN